jgi:hypothetical protein
LEEVVYTCSHCKKECKGKQIGAHYRNEKECKYMRDRPWIKRLPPNWLSDLELFEKDESMDA